MVYELAPCNGYMRIHFFVDPCILENLKLLEYVKK